MPLSYGIYFDFLGGNLPVCFTQLRMLLEQLAKCSMSDLKYPDLTFFQERIKSLETEMERERGSLTELIRSRSISVSRLLILSWKKVRSGYFRSDMEHFASCSNSILNCVKHTGRFPP